MLESQRLLKGWEDQNKCAWARTCDAWIVGGSIN